MRKLACHLTWFGIAMVLILYQATHPVTFDLPNGLGAMTYARVYPAHALGHYQRWITIEDALPDSLLFDALYGGGRICVARGTDPVTGHTLVRLRESSGIAWIDLDEGCLTDNWKPTRSGPRRRQCDHNLNVRDAGWVEVGVIAPFGFGPNDQPQYRTEILPSDLEDCEYRP